MDTRQLHAAEQRLASFLAELVPHMGRAEGQHWAGMYIRGLLLDGERKSIEPMAARLPGADVQALWTVYAGDKLLAARRTDLQRPAGESYDTYVAALSGMFGELSRQIASALQGAPGKQVP